MRDVQRKLFDEFFRCVSSSKKRKIYDPKLIEITKKLLEINYSENQVESTYLYEAALVHEAGIDFSEPNVFYDQLIETRRILNLLLAILKSAEKKQRENIFQEIENNPLLRIAGNHVGEKNLEFRTPGHTIAARMPGHKFHNRKIIANIESFWFALEESKRKRWKIFRFVLIKDGKDIAHITGYAHGSHTFYIQFIENIFKYENKISVWDLARLYRFVEGYLKKHGYSRITVLCVKELQPIIQRYGFRPTGWKEKAFGVSLFYLVKSI